MSIASDALSLVATSYLANTAICGETVTFRSASHSVHIDRNAGDGTEPGGQINSSTRESYSVLFLASVSEPLPGEIITTAASHKLRIEHVKFLSFGWQCRCAIKR